MAHAPRLLSVAAATLLGLAGCESVCEEVVTVREAAALQGEVSWVHDGEPGTARIDAPDTPGAPCKARVTLGSSRATSNSGAVSSILPDHTVFHTAVAVECFNTFAIPGAQASDYFFVSTFAGDLRQWELGPVPADTLAAPDEASLAAPFLASREDCSDPANIESCTLCVADIDGPIVTAEVLETAGAPAGFPAVVTGEFRKVIRFTIDTGTPVAGTSAPDQPCAQARSATATFDVAVVAADFVHDPCAR